MRQDDSSICYTMYNGKIKVVRNLAFWYFDALINIVYVVLYTLRYSAKVQCINRACTDDFGVVKTNVYHYFMLVFVEVTLLLL